MSHNHIYADRAIPQIPRLLSCLDRNEFSPSFGCFNREFWLTRVRDFPDAISQFGTLSLALAWSYKFPGGEKFYHNPEIKKWTLAGIKYWTKIQHKDGSYDEFYPNERGWAGPTGFLLYAMLRSYEVLDKELPNNLENKFFSAVKKSAWFLATREEDGVLANHHAMAILPIYQAYYHLKDKDKEFADKLYKLFETRLEVFFKYCYEEGWCLEYDGVDPGYLSAIVSFLSKMQRYIDPSEPWAGKIQTIIDKAVKFSSYFLYPNGSYGGTLGSRQTLHFYAHGYELQAKENKLAMSCAEFALQSLDNKKLVPPEIQDDRYYLYRIPEFLEAHIDYTERQDDLKLLPQQEENFEKYFPDAKVFIKKTEQHYFVLNLSKGGILKIFDKNKLIFSDDGILLKSNNKILTSQWIDLEYKINHQDNSYQISGQLHKIPQKYFTPIKMIIFRIFMLLFGWNARVADWIKGMIRKTLMTKSAKSSISFIKKITFDNHQINIENTIKSKDAIEYLKIGGQFAARYVPQSRYFQWEELDNKIWTADQKIIELLNKNHQINITSIFNLENHQTHYQTKPK